MFNRELSRQMGSGPDEKMVKKYMRTLEEKMDGYERILSNQRYLAGNVSSLLCAMFPECAFIGMRL